MGVSRLVVLLFAVSGCALVQDFDHYTAGRDAGDVAVEEGADEIIEDTGEIFLAEDSAIFPVDDTAAPPPMDTGSAPDTAATDTAPVACSTLCAMQGVQGATQCVDGKCLCRSGATKCGSTCTYLDADPLHCGGCGNAIPDVTQTCGGSCLPNLKYLCKAFGYGTTCPVKCLDGANEGNHCTRITYDGTSTYTHWERCLGGYCQDSVCTTGCSGGRTACVAKFREPTDSNVHSCVDLLHDPNYCGECGKSCKVGEVCAEGKCRGYHPARAKEDCMATQTAYTPYGWGKLVCLD
jgi:hypothetical protein